MAHYCPDCKQLFQKRVFSCPLCGYSTVSDDTPDQVYLENGYQLFSLSSSQLRNNTEENRVHIEDADLISQIRYGYDSYINNLNINTHSASDSSTPSQTSDNFFGSYAPQVPRTDPEPVPTASSPSNANFFASYTSDIVQPPVMQPEPIDVEFLPASSSTNSFSDGHNHYQVPGSGGLSFRRFMNGLGRFLSAVPWRLVFSLALIGIVCWGLYSIWQQRMAILDALMGFFIALLPIVLIIGIVIWFIRSLFR